MSGGIMTDSIINNVVGGRSSSNEPRMVALYPQGQYNVRQVSVYHLANHALTCSKLDSDECFLITVCQATYCSPVLDKSPGYLFLQSKQRRHECFVITPGHKPPPKGKHQAAQ